MIIAEWLKDASNFLQKNNIKNPQLEAIIILSFFLKKSKTWIYGFNNKKISLYQIKKLKILLKRRANKEPIAYILGYREFWSLNLYITPAVLIPRKETEILVLNTLQKISYKTKNILDLGTGSGAIALAIAKEHKYLNITAIDLSIKAIKIAKYNSYRLNLYNINFIHSNWFDQLYNQKFDIIVSNPPYISNKEYLFLYKYLRYEPYKSLVTKQKGLYDLKYIIIKSANYLYNFGWLILEHAPHQILYLRKFLKKNHFYNIHSYMDLNQQFRVICAQKIFNKNH
ncbi:peptide chain release factor N(5)-glutamine methyltransferase [Enterobacteriaceae endosymbiont of Neohaemonia nigricornis]|uniref:peptide chain release factor N(5)-glutamine methyltransferase n=1 Tax=Enterobacteriaceae endosymbiont of Neohaemonia nigricornis TaxID=2675792 RepID=UPI001448E69B|nr:peptide chain release factor N(5)-glutamine methyltransferase [Enterobacteriaceae endosymbiont of Neohaemonia nigricornis]QJC30304.1 peptide chain release factor N(5)-glutamine methyltransferase [Enterobacteriaceae endosymbiont of Neohaemonia nigricornis]